MGGPSSGLTWVGEKGPELLDLPSGSYVHNNKDSQKMAGGITITIGSINASSEADGRKAARIIIDTVTRELQKRKLLAA